MRTPFILSLMALLFATFMVPAQPQNAPYQIDFDQHRDVVLMNQGPDGSEGIFIKVRFRVKLDDKIATNLGSDFTVAIEEDGKRVKVVELPRPTVSEAINVVLAMDTSGSMLKGHRMEQARDASRTFLTKLPPKADCGLVLFDHQIRTVLPLTTQRPPLRDMIEKIQPRGGTAFLDAAYKSIELLGNRPPGVDRAVVLMTDGIDLNSTRTLPDVMAFAKKLGVRVYTIGIGEPGKQDPVSTALVLDRSGSMGLPADEDESVSKIQALHEAGDRFIRSMSSSGRALLIPFSSGKLAYTTDFTQDKAFLSKAISRLRPGGETALFDALVAGIQFLRADETKGKRAVVAMTDGIDNASRFSMGDAIRRARESEIPIYLLGFGRAGELDEQTMRRLANESGGEYFHARNRESLIEIFENLSIRLHDDGIDEKALTTLASETGGQYFPAKNVADLKFILERVSTTLQREAYEIVFPSLRQVQDGTQRNVALKLLRRGAGATGETVVQHEVGRYQTQGLVVAEMNHLVYLSFLAILLGLIALPSLPSLWKFR